MLSGSRMYGMTPGPILLSDIKAYIELIGLPVEKMEFIQVIKSMDKVYLDKSNHA